MHIDWRITPTRRHPEHPRIDPLILADLDALQRGLVDDFAIAPHEASRNHPA